MATSNVKGGDSKMTSNTNFSSLVQDLIRAKEGLEAVEAVEPDTISSSTEQDYTAQIICNSIIKCMLCLVILFLVVCVIVIFGILYLYYYDVI